MVSNSDNAARVDFVTRRGDTFTRRVAFTQTEAGVVSPENLTGSAFKMQVRRKASKITEPLMEWTVGDFVVDIEAGAISFKKTAAQMAVCEGIYAYDLQQTYPDGTVRTRLAGDFIIHNDVTQ